MRMDSRPSSQFDSPGTPGPLNAATSSHVKAAPWRRRMLGVLALLVLGGAAWAAGFFSALVVAPAPVPVPSDVSAPAGFALFNEAWHTVDSEFYGHIPPAATIAADAVKGMVGSIKDPYAAIIAPSAVATATVNYLPVFVPNVGAWIQAAPNGARVLSIVPGTPADQIRLQPGDLVAAQEDTELSGLGRDQMVAILDHPAPSTASSTVPTGTGSSAAPTGTAGSTAPSGTVSPTVPPGAFNATRFGTDKATSTHWVIIPQTGPPYAVAITHSLTTTPVLAVRDLAAAPGMTYLRIPNIDAGVIAQLDQVGDRIKQAPGRQRLIIDLRDNPGGAYSDVRAMASRLVDGPVWVTVDQAKKESVEEADARGVRRITLPADTVILINEGTDGGAEILAAALRDDLGAKLVGQPSAGNDTIQDLIKLSDGSLLRLTVAEWHSPKGASVHDKGLEPDVAVAHTAEDRAAGGDDPQMAAAVTAERLPDGRLQAPSAAKDSSGG